MFKSIEKWEGLRRLHPSLSIYRQLVVAGGGKDTFFSNVAMSKAHIPVSNLSETCWVIKHAHEIEEVAVV